MTEEKIKDFVEDLEQAKTEAQGSYWFDSDKKYETLNELDEAIGHLKNVAYLLYDCVIED